MNKEVGENLATILGVTPGLLDELDRTMTFRVGRPGVLERVYDENQALIKKTLANLSVQSDKAEDIRAALRTTAAIHEEHLLKYLEGVPGATQFEKAVTLAKRIANIEKGFFLKKSFGADILRKRRPENLLKFLGFASVDEMLAHHDVAEIFSALRFIESTEWMHETFADAYKNFTAADFEEREVEIRVLGPEWHDVAAQFVAKKHHNVSHLKEFGVIFLNPIAEDVRGKFLRDFALLLHYCHEVAFYSRMFRVSAGMPDFATRLMSLLRGDVNDVKSVGDGQWLIIQRYLVKENPTDPRLFLPHVNPESLHWLRGERDLATLGQGTPGLGLELWANLDWVGSLFDHGNERVVSFDLEDEAMSAVSAAEGKDEFFNYHQREAMWTKIFAEYAGGEAAMDKLLVENFLDGVITF